MPRCFQNFAVPLESPAAIGIVGAASRSSLAPREPPMISRLILCLAITLAGTAVRAEAATINITPSDNYTKIEAAQAGDEVVIAPGTYRFRVYLTGQGTRSNPIKIRAQDPNNKPVWDFSAGLVENAPGSYTAGDRGRGGWQLSGGANYQISGIIFTNCRNT